MQKSRFKYHAIDSVNQLRGRGFLGWSLSSGDGTYPHFFDQLLSFLDVSENAFVREKEAKVADLRKRFDPHRFRDKEEKAEVADYFHDEFSEIRDECCVFGPLFARYTALAMAVAMVEWHVLRLYRVERGIACVILRNESGQYSSEAVEAAQKLPKKFLGRAGHLDVLKVLKGFAESVGDDNHQGLQIFEGLRTLRHLVVHCAGNLEESRNEKRDEAAAKLLGFDVGNKVVVDNEGICLPAKHVIIERGGLKHPLGKVQDFLLEMSEKKPRLLPI